MTYTEESARKHVVQGNIANIDIAMSINKEQAKGQLFRNQLEKG